MTRVFQKHKTVTFLIVAEEFFTGVYVVLEMLGYDKAHCHKGMHRLQCCHSETSGSPRFHLMGDLLFLVQKRFWE